MNESISVKKTLVVERDPTMFFTSTNYRIMHSEVELRVYCTDYHLFFYKIAVYFEKAKHQVSKLLLYFEIWLHKVQVFDQR